MEFVKTIIVSTLTQFWWLFGVMGIMGLLLYTLARYARSNFVKSLGPSFDTYFTGWIGTPIHEFGHWLFCIIFRHKVKEVRFFQPDKASGTLGYVSHSFDSKSIYQRIGNFFIGIGPILVGSMVIGMLAYFMLPNQQRIVNHFNDFILSWPIEVSYGWKVALSSVLDNLWIIFRMFFLRADYSSLSFWIFVYVSFAISSHMMLSISDLKTSGYGVISLIALLLMLNILSLLLSKFSSSAIPFTLTNKVQLLTLKVGAYFIFILSFSLVMSALSFLISLVVRGVAAMVSK